MSAGTNYSAQPIIACIGNRREMHPFLVNEEVFELHLFASNTELSGGAFSRPLE